MREEIPFLIVGGGPSGMTAARLLANEGQRCLLVERRDGPQTHPSAHVVNARTLEIFRQAGMDMAAIGAIAKDPADAGHVNFVTRLTGDLIGRLPFERQGDETLGVTPTPLRNISQHRLEPLLAAEAAAAGVDVRYRTVWESSSQDPEGVTSVIRDLDTGEPHEVRSGYLLAADGAGSGIRTSLGIEMIGPASLDTYVAIHVEAGLRDRVADRPGVLHFVMDPEVRGVFIAHDLDREWVYMCSYDADTETEDDYDAERCAAIVRTAIGDPSAELAILGARAWNMSAQVGERMRDRRVFLIGDAAHRFPPTGGLGLNTGVGDAHNLVWKLAAVADGWAAPPILDTYEVERHPVAEVNCRQSTTNAFKMVLLWEALGAGEAPTTEAMNAALADPARRDAIDAAVAEQRTHFDMIGLQLGYCYADGAIAGVGAPPSAIDDPSRFEPTAAVGERLPHAWCGDGRSTLDLVAAGGMTLISLGAHDAWAAAIDGLSAPVCQVRIGGDVEVGDEWRTRCGLGSDGALLVRPDQHVAWRAVDTSRAPDALRDALDQILGRANRTPT